MNHEFWRDNGDMLGTRIMKEPTPKPKPEFTATVDGVEVPVLYFIRETVKYDMMDVTGVRVLGVTSESTDLVQGYESNMVNAVVFTSIEPDEVGKQVSRLKDEFEERALDKPKPSVIFSAYPDDSHLYD